MAPAAPGAAGLAWRSEERGHSVAAETREARDTSAPSKKLLSCGMSSAGWHAVVLTLFHETPEQCATLTHDTKEWKTFRSSRTIVVRADWARCCSRRRSTSDGAAVRCSLT